MANNKLDIRKLQKYLNGKNTFTGKDIEQFYRQIEPGIKATAINWRLYTLVHSGVFSRIGRGKFILGGRRNFIPEISLKMKSIYKKLQKQFPYMQSCIWNTSVLNELMVHQPGRFYTLVEVDKEATESVFYFLKDKMKNIFLEPSSNILSLYASSKKEVIIIKSLVSEAPAQKIRGVPTITIEKLLVDIFCDEIVFAAQQGIEMQTIFRNAFEKYSINENKMIRYADRRGKKEDFNIYLNKISKFRQQR